MTHVGNQGSRVTAPTILLENKSWWGCIPSCWVTPSWLDSSQVKPPIPSLPKVLWLCAERWGSCWALCMFGGSLSTLFPYPVVRSSVKWGTNPFLPQCDLTPGMMKETLPSLFGHGRQWEYIPAQSGGKVWAGEWAEQARQSPLWARGKPSPYSAETWQQPQWRSRWGTGC